MLHVLIKCSVSMKSPEGNTRSWLYVDTIQQVLNNTKKILCGQQELQ